MDRGDVRLITVSRPNNEGVASGLLLTLSNPQASNFTPASVPVVIRRLGEHEQKPQLGFVHPGAPDYEAYRAQLRKVVLCAPLLCGWFQARRGELLTLAGGLRTTFADVISSRSGTAGGACAD